MYSSAQFLCIFLGGVLGGWCHGHFGLLGGFAFGLGTAAICFMPSLRWCTFSAVHERA